MDNTYLYILLALIAVQTTYLSATKIMKNKRQSGRLVFVDTSVLIDGRIVSIAESGFFPGTLAIPRSVVGELQFLADNGDSEKRSRARHGLDVVKELQTLNSVEAVIFPDGVRADEGVDNRLLELAKRHKGSICTIDYNLNKVAQVEDIDVLNVNDLAKTLRMSYLPGEKLAIELTQKGNDSHQAVGHLTDGTMVVVENANQFIGKTVEVEFIRSLQTSAGKMMFGRIASAPQRNSTKPSAKKAALKATKPANRVARPVAKTTPKTATKPQKKQGAQNGGRRRTPEDKLVELANS